jgi:hypothetical protein
MVSKLDYCSGNRLGPAETFADAIPFATNNVNRQELLCNYPIIQKKEGTSQTSSTGTAPASAITYPTSGGKNITVSFGGASPPKKIEYHIEGCASGPLKFTTPDPSFLSPPSCVICDDPDSRYKQDNIRCVDNRDPKNDNPVVICLHTNWRLRNDWLKYADSPLSVPYDAIVLGQRKSKVLYVESKDDLEAFYEFSLFINEATAQIATSGTAIVSKGLSILAQ